MINKDALKCTSGNNWAHVVCAFWHGETRVADSTSFTPIEGIGNIDLKRWSETCVICKRMTGAVVSCHTCHANVHVTCAARSNYIVAFDIQPVKSSRRDQVTVVTFGGETGLMSPVVWCPEHDLRRTIYHPMHEFSKELGKTALQIYVENYKQADLRLTGTMRRAQIINSAVKLSRKHLDSLAQNNDVSSAKVEINGDKILDIHCVKCMTTISPYFYDNRHDNSRLCHKCYITEQFNAMRNQFDDKI